MGIYICGIKISENSEKIVYAYGHNKNNLNGKVEIIKSSLEENSIQYTRYNEITGCFNVILKVRDYYIKNNLFPDNVYYQS